MANNTIHQVTKVGIVMIQSSDQDPITLRSAYYLPNAKKELFHG